MARLDFEAAWKLNDPTSAESQKLAWRIAWYRDDLGAWARLFPERVRQKGSGLEDALATMRSPARPLRRHELGSKSASAVTLTATRSIRGRMPFGLPCKIGGVDATATVILGYPVTYVASNLVSEAGWADISFSEAGGKVLTVRTLVVPAQLATVFGGVVIGADLARYLHFSFDLASSSATISQVEPTQRPTARSVALYWPLGEYPTTKVGIYASPTEAVDAVGYFFLSDTVWVDSRWVRETIPWRIAGARLGPLDLRVDEAPSLSLPREELDVNAVIGWNAFAGHKVTLGTGGRELWIE